MNPRLVFAIIIGLVFKRQICVSASVVISEIAFKGSSHVCSGNDWLELHNTDSSASVDLSGYTLHDDKGIGDDKAFTFPQDYNTLLPGEYRLLCTNEDSADSPQFSIGTDDTVTLVSTDGTSTRTAVASVGPLPGTRNDVDVTYAWDSDTGGFIYTSTPTPGLPNVLTPAGETSEEIKERLARQNDQATSFFGMDSQGLPVEDAFDDVLDFHLSMEDEDYQYMMENTFFEEYVPFQSAQLVTAFSPGKLQAQQEIHSITSPGRIRTKGHISVYFGSCLGTTTVPFQLEFDPSDTLFGVEKLYLRSHFIDPTYTRDWAYNRMLARFGLPHLRARKVRLFINGDYIGFYTLIEAMDSEYVFARSFPDYDPFNYALYKWKTEAQNCGRAEPDILADAEMRVDDPSFQPPYSFQRGPHRVAPPPFPECIEAFFDDYQLEKYREVATLYLRHGSNCGEMLVEEGLMDRDLGDKKWDAAMKEYINKYLTEQVVDGNSEIDQDVDLESFLKTIAFYAVMLSEDTIMNHINNFFMAQAGDGKGFKLLAYDHNIGPANFCSSSCGDHAIHWSIARPTCQALEFQPVVGALLLKPSLHKQYLEYVRDFVEQVASSSSLLEEINNHSRAIHHYVEEDFWKLRFNFDRVHFLTEAEDWDRPGVQEPLVPFLKARVEDVREQLKAMDEGTFPRGPHQPVKEAIYEECVDWRRTEPPEVACYNNCLYDGCYKGNWVVSHKCIEETGTCIHGTQDVSCRDIPDGEKYAGMQSQAESNGRDTFCMSSGGLPIKASICPLPSAGQDVPNYHY